ncbi:MAG: hypothetical protein M0R48_10115 [Candidatus Omnitrophica bacterium]|nr:hypothetical protein [Candidatus Omnitrophota bacterium]
MKNDAIPLPELKKQYYPAKDIALVEETDQEKARSLFESKCSCCWGNTIIGDTGWAVIGSPSKQHDGDMRMVFVCKANLLG